MMKAFLGGKRVRLDPSRSIGKGGEADVFDLGDGRALKLFKLPDHPDYRGQPHEQQAAEERLALHQRKLRAFPAGLPAEVVAPEELATDRLGRRILGYAMRRVVSSEPLLRFADPAFRRAGVPGDRVVRLFVRLHQAIGALHRAGVVIGDFNDRNVLVRGEEPFLIDADSFQFAGFPCGVFTDRFVDPTLCDPQAPALLLERPHTAGSDWYAFAVLLMQSLLFVGPYGGIHKPKDPKDRVPPSARPHRRLTVFHPEVVYPKPAARPETLPDDLLQLFHRVFEQDERAAFPLRLLEGLRFQTCPRCAAEHARLVCPACSPSAALRKSVAVEVRGEVVCRHLFETRGLVVHAQADATGVRWIVHEAGAYRREDGREVLRAPLDPGLRFRILGGRTLVGRGSELRTLEPDSEERLAVDEIAGLPAFDTDGRRRLWVQGGRLWRDGDLRIAGVPEPEVVGEALAGQTRIWAGPAFGLGLYRAGALSVAFLFENARRGLNDSLALPPLPGELLDAACHLDETRAWLLLSLHAGGRTRNLCLVWSRAGALEAAAEAEAGDGGWLGTLGAKVATSGMLLAATDAGLVRLEVHGDRIEKTREFPDTEPFVSADCRLLVGPDGLVVARPRSLAVLQLK